MDIPQAPQAPSQGLSATAAPLASTLGPPAQSRSAELELLFGAALGLLLLCAALTLAPRAVLPGRASEIVELHRESVLTLLCAVALGVAIGLSLVFLS